MHNANQPQTSLNDASQQHWDAIVVGTGIGGATAGYALAKAGRKVLFLDKGRSTLKKCKSSLHGDYAEHFLGANRSSQDARADVYRRANRLSEKLEDCTQKRSYEFTPLLGSGSGGSSALFGMVMERFFPEDFSPKAFFPDAPGADVPDQWPIRYETLRPFYQAAEKLYRVRGALDPLREGLLDALPAPPELNGPNRELFDLFQQKRLHPYHLPMACEYVPDCKECLGFVCARDCKNDAARVCVQPAVQHHGAVFLDECEVLGLEADQAAVTGVRCRRAGATAVLRADVVVLGAGAVHTAALLLKSKSANWPHGVANRSGLVGRNLMRHYLDLYCVETKVDPLSAGLVKQLAFNDLYLDRETGEKLGTVQSVGRLASPDSLTDDLLEEMDRKGMRWLSRLLKPAKPLIRKFAQRKITGRVVLTGIMEDLPYPDNRVTVSNGPEAKVQIHFEMPPAEQRRLATFRRKIKSLLRSYPTTFIGNAHNNERLAHACGTCRFGEDPEHSVLDPNNRAHGIENLYVVDSSFFPTSSGINPALTIAANALRVASAI